jgi:hypothetical protein
MWEETREALYGLRSLAVADWDPSLFAFSVLIWNPLLARNHAKKPVGRVISTDGLLIAEFFGKGNLATCGERGIWCQKYCQIGQ